MFLFNFSRWLKSLSKTARRTPIRNRQVLAMETLEDRATPSVLATTTSGGHTYHILSGAGSWTASRSEAQSLGGDLAIISNSTENSVLTNFINGYSASGGYWIGLNDAASEGTYRWVDNSVASYFNWASGWPNGAGDYVEMQTNGWFNLNNNLNYYAIAEVNSIASLSIGDASLTEGNSGSTFLSFPVTRSGGSGAGVTVSYSTSSGSATSGVDFIGTSGTLTFSAGQTTAFVNVLINGDTTVELNEFFSVNLFSPVNATISDSSATGTIGNNDSATVSINSASTTEGIGVSFAVTLSNPVDVATSVTVTTSGGSATQGTDYTGLSNFTVNFAAGVTSQTVAVLTTQESLVEATETFAASLGGLNNGGRSSVSIGSGTGTGTGTIFDNDTATFFINGVTVNEAAGALTFTVSLSNPIDQTAKINVGYSGGTAIGGGVDYDSTIDQVTFAAGSTAALAVTVGISNDNIVEATESFLTSLSLDSSTPLTGRSSNTNSTSTGSITDNDSATVSVTGVTVNENNNLVFLVTLSNPVSATVTVEFDTANGSAIAGSDYTAITNQVVTFVANDTSETVAVILNDDQRLESLESLTGQINTLNNGGRNVTIGVSGANGFITDNESATLSFGSANGSTSEDAGAAHVPVMLTLSTVGSFGSPGLDRTVVAAVTDAGTGTATPGAPPGGDYTFSSPTSLAFATGSNGTSFVQDAIVSISQDLVLDPNETVALAVAVQNGNGTGTATAFPSSYTLTINDSGTPPTVASDNAAVTASEGSVATNSGTYSDAQGNGTVTITASVGTIAQNPAAGTWTWSLDAADGPAGPFTVTVTATDNQGTAATATFNYAVNNVPPTISLSGNATVNEGSPYTLNLGVVTDPGQDTITAYIINWGDGTNSGLIYGNPANTTATHIFADGPANQTNTITVTDEDGDFLAGSLSVQVLNVSPTATLQANSGVTYGNSTTVTLANPFDPSTTDVTAGLHYAFSLNTDTTGSATYASTAGSTNAMNFGALDAGTYTVFARIIDKDGGSTQYQTTVTVNKADAVVAVAGYSGIYDAAAHGVSGTATGVGGVDLSSLLNLGVSFTDAPGGTAHWTFSGGTNYLDESGHVAIIIAKADATITVTGYAVTYDAAAHAATGTATGVGGVDLSSLLDLSGTAHTNAGTYGDAWTFAGNGNYNAAGGTVADAIAKADANVEVAPYGVTYDGNVQFATGTATGVLGELLAGLDLSGTAHTNAGTYAGDIWTFTDTTGNYNDASGTVTDAIGKAASVTTVTIAPGPFAYTGAAQTPATVTVTGVGGLNETFAASYLNNTNAGTATASYAYAGDANHTTSSDSALIVINKANASIVVNGYTGVYDGAAHGATGSAKGVNNESLSGLALGASFTNVPGGVANWTFTDSTGNYNDASGSVDIVINKAEQQITWATPAAITYGAALGASQLNATVTGVSGGSASGALSYAPVAGTILTGGNHTLTVTAAETANYNAATKSVVLTVNKAALTVTTDAKSRGYGDANPTLTGTVTGLVAGDSITATYSTAATATSPVGGYAITATLSDPNGRLSNYTFSNPDNTLTVTPATLTVTVDAVSRTYGSANPTLTGAITGQKNGESFTAAYSTLATETSPVGAYDVTAVLSGATLTNYNVVVNGDDKLAVNKAALTVTPSGASRVYGTANPTLSGSVVGIQNGDAITATYSTAATIDSGAGTYDITAALVDPGNKLGNYTVSLNVGHLSVTKADAAITVNGYSGTYDAAAHGLTGSATGVAGENLSGLLDLGPARTDAGTYTTPWSFAGSANYNAASGSKVIDIAKADAAVSVIGFSGVYDGAAHGVVGSAATGVGGAALTGLVVDTTAYTDVPGGLVHWTFTNPNYKDQSGDAAVTITPAPSATAVTAGDATFDGGPHGGAATVTGASGLSQALTVTYTGRNGTVYSSTAAPTGAGDYTASAGYAGDTNHAPSAGSKDFTIAKATSATSVTGGTFTYDAAGHGATAASVTGAGGLSTSPTLVYKDAAGNVIAGLPTNAGSYTVCATYTGDANHTGNSATATIVIGKATPTVSVVGGSYVYDEQGHPATGSVTGVGGASLGTPTFTYSYTDDDGHVVTDTTPPVDPGYYTVTASFAGNANYNPASTTATIMIAFEVRTLTDLSKAFNAGRTIPIKIQLTDAAGNNLSSAGIDLTAILLERVNADGSVTQVSLQDAGGANPGNLFRYDDALQGYIFNLSTKGLGAGTYDFYWLSEGDPTEHKLRFRLV